MVKALEYLSSAEVKARDSFHDAANLLNWIPVTKRVYQRRDKITREKNIEVVDVDVLDEPVQKDKSSKGNEIVVYDVSVHLAHMQSLAPKASLISPIINFYIEHLKNVTLPSADTECKFQIFRTQFYEKLKEHSQIKDEAQKRSFFVKLRRWWADENLLEFSFIIVPVFEHCHWSVAILCMPSNAYPSPTVLLLDSLGLHANEPIFAIMKSLIEQECAYSDQSEERPPRIVKEIPKVPKQNNGWDCGLFMLLYIKKFLIESVRLEKLEFGEHWFATEEVSNLRNTIRCLLEAEFRQKALQNEASDQCLERTSLVSQKS